MCVNIEYISNLAIGLTEGKYCDDDINTELKQFRYR